MLGHRHGASRGRSARFVDPLIAATYPIPKSSILPLILLIFGLGEMSKVVMVAIGVFYPIAINATAGVLQINQIYLDVGKSFKAPPLGDVPHHRAAGRAAVHHDGREARRRARPHPDRDRRDGGRQSGIGYMIWSAWETFSVERMYVGLFVIAHHRLCVRRCLNEVERWVIRWKADI